MRQIEAFELVFIIRYELGRIAKSTLNDMASGHQATKRRGVEIAADRLLARMEKWEIIVPEASGNIFEGVGEGFTGRFADRQKGPT